MGIIFINKAVLLQGYRAGFKWLRMPFPPREGLQSTLNVKPWIRFREKQEQAKGQEDLSHNPSRPCLVWIAYPALALDTSCHGLILIQTHVVPHCIRVMARLLVLTSRLYATLPTPRNCRHHHHHSLPYSFTEHWAGQTYNKALLKVLYPMPEARVTGPASSEAKQVVRLSQKDASVLEACQPRGVSFPRGQTLLA